MSWLYQPLLPAGAQILSPSTIIGEAAQTLAINQSASGKVGIAGSATQTLTLNQSAAGKIGIAGSAAQTLTLNQSSTGVISITGAASQTLEFSQSTAGVVTIGGSATQTLGFSQTTEGSVTVAVTSTRFAVQRAVYEAAQTALVGLGVSVYDFPPHHEAYPYVVFDQHQTLPMDGAELPGFTHLFYMSIWSNYRGRREVEGILTRLWHGFHDQQLVLEEGTFVLCQVTDQRSERDADSLTYQGAMTLSVITNPISSI